MSCDALCITVHHFCKDFTPRCFQDASNATATLRFFRDAIQLRAHALLCYCTTHAGEVLAFSGNPQKVPMGHSPIPLYRLPVR